MEAFSSFLDSSSAFHRAIIGTSPDSGRYSISVARRVSSIRVGTYPSRFGPVVDVEGEWADRRGRSNWGRFRSRGASSERSAGPHFRAHTDRAQCGACAPSRRSRFSDSALVRRRISSRRVDQSGFDFGNCPRYALLYGHSRPYKPQHRALKILCEMYCNPIMSENRANAGVTALPIVGQAEPGSL